MLVVDVLCGCQEYVVMLLGGVGLEVMVSGWAEMKICSPAWEGP